MKRTPGLIGLILMLSACVAGSWHAAPTGWIDDERRGAAERGLVLGVVAGAPTTAEVALLAICEE
ncbi:MAG: hypothetical protein ACJ8CR_03940 [Roseiflexaceae bacterium]